MSKNKNKTALIIANGEISKNIQNIKADFICVCDGAISSALMLNITPDLIIGDLDSIPKDLLQKYKSIIKHRPDQSKNDLTKALNHSVEIGFNNFIIVGLSGKREDHTLANISLLFNFIKDPNIKSLITKSDYGEFSAFVIDKKLMINSSPGEQISLFCNNKEAKFNSSNLKYELSNFSFTNWHCGSLNECKGDHFMLESDLKTEILVYKAYERH
ncbi:MAG: thiamine diphosphokinase [Helicobacter sp.]|nr:thiamine diphosphokinase [Helicobacter sp.]